MPFLAAWPASEGDVYSFPPKQITPFRRTRALSHLPLYLPRMTMRFVTYGARTGDRPLGGARMGGAAQVRDGLSVARSW